MTIQDELVRAEPGAGSAKIPVAPGSWESRSCDELRAIASRGAHGGELYFAAVAELERRAHDLEIAQEHQHAEVEARRKEVTWWLAALIGSLAIGAIARVLGY